MLIKVLVMLEGTARLLEPNFSLMELIQPYQKKMLRRRLSPARQMRKVRRIYSEVEQLAEVLPRRLRDILQQVESGKFDVHLDHRGLEPSVNRLVLGMLTSSLFLGSSLLISQTRVADPRRVGARHAGRAAQRVPRLAAAAGDRQIGPARSAEVDSAVQLSLRPHVATEVSASETCVANSGTASDLTLRYAPMLCLLSVHAAQLFELERQAMTQRAFRAQLFQQLFRAFERGRFEIAAFEHLAPTTRNLLLG